jgi:hypothetical protein
MTTARVERALPLLSIEVISRHELRLRTVRYLVVFNTIGGPLDLMIAGTMVNIDFRAVSRDLPIAL